MGKRRAWQRRFDELFRQVVIYRGVASMAPLRRTVATWKSRDIVQRMVAQLTEMLAVLSALSRARRTHVVWLAVASCPAIEFGTPIPRPVTWPN